MGVAVLVLMIRHLENVAFCHFLTTILKFDRGRKNCVD